MQGFEDLEQIPPSSSSSASSIAPVGASEILQTTTNLRWSVGRLLRSISIKHLHLYMNFWITIKECGFTNNYHPHKSAFFKHRISAPSKNSITGPSKRPRQWLLANLPPPVDRVLGDFTVVGRVYARISWLNGAKVIFKGGEKKHISRVPKPSKYKTQGKYRQKLHGNATMLFANQNKLIFFKMDKNLVAGLRKSTKLWKKSSYVAVFSSKKNHPIQM